MESREDSGVGIRVKYLIFFMFLILKMDRSKLRTSVRTSAFSQASSAHLRPCAFEHQIYKNLRQDRTAHATSSVQSYHLFESKLILSLDSFTFAKYGLLVTFLNTDSYISTQDGLLNSSHLLYFII